MRRALIAIIAAVIVLATGTYFGSELWAQFRTKGEVEAVFDSLRTAFATATHGKVVLYSKTRSIKISDITLQSSDRATTVKIGQIVAVGTRGPTGGRVGAGRIEITDWELATTIPTAAGATVVYKAPSIVVEAFSGPAALPLKVEAASMADVIRASLEYVAASSANAITLPKLSATVSPKPSGDPKQSIGPIEYTYTAVAFREIRNRRIGEFTTERVTVTSELATSDVGSFAGAMARFTVSDFNLDAPIAFFDPTKGKDDSYIPMYRQISAGPLEFRFAKGGGVQIEGVSVEGVGIRPSKLSYANLIAIADSAQKSGPSAPPQQTGEMLEQIANAYEGIRIDKMEWRGFRTDIQPDAVVKLGALRFTGLEHGRLAEFAIEGFDGITKKADPIRIGKFALKGLHFSNLIRQSAKLASDGAGPPSVEQSLLLFSLLEGIEVNDVVGNSPLDQKHQIRIDTFQFSWGKFVGPIPTTVRLTTKMTVPSTLADSTMGGMLSDAGMPNVTTSMDIGLAWNERDQTLVLSPAGLELENAFTFSAKFSVRNVSRDMFSLDLTQAMNAANATEIGPLEIILHDTGAVKTALEQYAKNKNLSAEDARKEIIESVMDSAKSSAQQNPDAMVVGQAIIQFIETPGSTLTIKVAPKGRVTVNQIFGVASADPNAASMLFTVEAKTTQ